MMQISVEHYLVVSAVLLVLGIFGIFLQLWSIWLCEARLASITFLQVAPLQTLPRPAPLKPPS